MTFNSDVLGDLLAEELKSGGHASPVAVQSSGEYVYTVTGNENLDTASVIEAVMGIAQEYPYVIKKYWVSGLTDISNNEGNQTEVRLELYTPEEGERLKASHDSLPETDTVTVRDYMDGKYSQGVGRRFQLMYEGFPVFKAVERREGIYLYADVLGDDKLLGLVKDSEPLIVLDLKKPEQLRKMCEDKLKELPEWALMETLQHLYTAAEFYK